MDVQTIVIISNTLVMIATFIATLYRIRLEEKQVKCTVQNIRDNEKLRILRHAIQKEQDIIRTMNGDEFLEFLQRIVEDNEKNKNVKVKNFEDIL